MNERELYEAVGKIADDLIMEACSPAVRVKRIRAWKIAAAAAVIVVMLGAYVWAASALIRGNVSVSNVTPDYVSVPSQKKLQDDIGIAPNIIERFSNGYIFKDGSIADNKDFDENGNVINSYKGLSCYYYNGKNKISMHVFPAVLSKISENMEIIDVFNGSEIKYKAYMTKVVPHDYQLTEQDKTDQASGKYMFSYGSKNIEILHVQFVRWEYDGIGYMLIEMNSDNKIEKEELADMAEEMISFQLGEKK